MKVLFAVWELDPFLKVGGLGDVAASLPRALKNLSVDIRLIIPFYKALKLGRSKKRLLKQFKVAYDGKLEKVKIYEVTHPTSLVPVYLLQNNRYLETPDFPDTFAFFDKAVVAASKDNHFAWKPEIIHCQDVHTGLIPLLVKQEKLAIKTMLTIHNLTYQGKTSLEILEKVGLKPDQCQITPWEIGSRQVNFLLEAIVHADLITTVSPTYAKEIMTEAYGAGLEEVLRAKEGRVLGILNGIDSPPKNADKNFSKRYLQKKLGLKVDPSLPLLTFIGRFDPKQKGIEILHKMLRTMDLGKYEFVILGKGDAEWEERFQWLDTFYPKNVACEFVFNDSLAKQIYAAADFVLIPSKFEPCGLIQMIAMGYGALPIAHKTGGLIDSIKDGQNGFLFENYSAEALTNTMEKAVKIWRSDKKQYREMVENALAADFSWDKSAKEYLRLYEILLTSLLPE